MRNEQLSILKGFGIILMVVGHSGAPDLLHDFVYLFHMALFYYASGYFFKEAYLSRKLEFVKKRVKGLYFPFLKYGIFFLLLHNVFFRFNIYNGEYGFQGGASFLYAASDYWEKFLGLLKFGGAEQLLGAYWFLSSLFIVSILFLCLFYFADRFGKQRKQSLLFVCIIFVYISGGGIATLGMHLPRSLEREMIALFPFYLGYLSNNNLQLKGFLSKHQNAGFGCVCCLLLLCLTRWGNIGLVGSEITNPLFFLLCTFLGCWMAMSFSVSLPWGRKFVAYAGEHTMGILTFHLLCFKLVSLLKIGYYDWPMARLAEFPVIEENNALWWLLYTVAGVGIPLSFAYMNRKFEKQNIL